MVWTLDTMLIKFRNTLKFILLICSLCICMSACGSKKPADTGYAETDISGEDDAYNAANEEAEAIDEREKFSGSEKYFWEKQEHISAISNGQCTLEKIGKDKGQYKIMLYDTEHVYVDSVVFSYCEPWVEAVTDTLLEISYNAGNPARYTFYFDMETARISDTFFNSILFGDQYIAYMALNEEDEIALTLVDLFNENILYQEIIRDFSPFADYMGAVIGIEMVDDHNIRLEYYEGTNMTIVSEIIELDWKNEAAEAESISRLHISGQTQEEKDLLSEILSENEEELQAFLMEDWDWPYVQWWVEILGFDFTGDGEKEIIVSKCYVYISQTISYNYVYDRDGNKLLEFVGGSLTGTHIISGWDGKGTFLLCDGNYYAAHMSANIFMEIRWENGVLKDEVKLIEYDSRDSWKVMEGKEGYYILKNLTREEEEKLWYGIDGLADLTQSKEYVWEDEDMEKYKQLFSTEDLTEFSLKGSIVYHKQDGVFVWYKHMGYTVEERTFFEQAGDWSIQISYPYIFGNFFYTSTDEVNQTIEQEFKNHCKTNDHTISYEIEYEIKYLDYGSISILFYGRGIPVNGDPASNIAWGVSYVEPTSRHTCVEDVMRMSELTGRLENREFEQVWGVGIDSYEEDAGVKDWSRIYLDCLLNPPDREHYGDFYVTDKKIGILLGVSHEAGDYIIVETDRDRHIMIPGWDE